MVFAVNADETGSSGKSFEAFQASAIRLNGTGTGSNSTGSSTSGKNGAGAVHLGGTGVALSIVAVIVGLTF
jgi:hypothetical protein